MDNDIVDRLRGVYRNKGYERQFDVSMMPPIQAEAANKIEALRVELEQASVIITDLRCKLAEAGVEGSPPPWEATIPRLQRRWREALDMLIEIRDESDNNPGHHSDLNCYEDIYGKLCDLITKHESGLS